MTLSATVSGDQPEADNSDNTLSQSTTVNASIDLRVSSISDSIDPVTLGQENVTYTVNIINDSTSKATNANVDITLPTGTFVSFTANSSGTCSGPVVGIVTCSWAGDLPAFNSRTATVTMTPTVGGTMTLSATVSGDQPEADNSDNTLSQSTTVNASIDLRVSSISDSIDPITLGTGNVTYTVNIINDSTSKATNAKVDMTLPASSTFVSFTANASGTCSGPTGGIVTCSWAGDLPAFNSRTATVTVTPTAGGTMTLSATVGGDQPEADNSDNTLTQATTVNASIDLRVSSVSDSIDPITLGTGNVVYTINIINDSTTKATNAKVDVTLPASATYVSATANSGGTCSGPTGGIVTCNWAGDLPAFNSRTATVTITPTVGGTMTLSATVGGDQPEADGSDNTLAETTAVNASIDLQLTMSDTPDPRVLGAGNVTYTVNVLNGSTSKATNAVVTFTLPSPATFVSATPNSGGTCTAPAGGVFTCTWTGDLPAFNSRSVTVIVTPTGVGQISATASVASDQPDPNTANNSKTETTNVNPSAPPVIGSFTPSSGPVSQVVTITGSNFFSTTLVKFNGVSATFTVVSNTSITATVPAGATTGLINITNFSGATSSASNFTVTPAPDLAITKTASAPTVPTSTAFDYTISVTNSGAGNSADQTVTDTLPAGVTLNSITAAGWTCSGTSTITCTRGNLPPSGTAATITINVTAPASGTTLTNTATVTSTTPETSTANNSSTVSVGVVGCPSTPAITAPATVCANSTGSIASTPAVPGATYAWTIANGTIVGPSTNDVISFDASTTDPITLNVSVFVTSCPTVSNSVNVNVSTPTATITPSGPTTFCAGGSVTLTANNAASWLWSTGATTQSIVVNTSTAVTVQTTDAAGCTATSS
ncbi:MAG TPA: IPT/TIG domain-containing protein, partial [Thermoanaerobaculia bacterium]